MLCSADVSALCLAVNLRNSRLAIGMPFAISQHCPTSNNNIFPGGTVLGSRFDLNTSAYFYHVTGGGDNAVSTMQTPRFC
jgi:hypothetical protein